MKIFAVANMKGGVGKTTTAVILADTLSSVREQRVLALDLDAQANLSWALLGPSHFDRHASSATLTRWLHDTVNGRTASLAIALQDVGLGKPRSFFARRRPPDAVVKLAVSTTRMRFEEFHFERQGVDGEKRLLDGLGEALDAIAPNFDCCVMDCSPALSVMTRVGLRLAHAVVIPTPPNDLCIQSLDTFVRLGLNEMLEAKAKRFVVQTRVSQSGGRVELHAAKNALRERAVNGDFTLLESEFRETAEYMRVLNPAETGPERTMKARYKFRVADLARFGEELVAKGVLA